MGKILPSPENGVKEDTEVAILITRAYSRETESWRAVLQCWSTQERHRAHIILAVDQGMIYPLIKLLHALKAQVQIKIRFCRIEILQTCMNQYEIKL